MDHASPACRRARSQHHIEVLPHVSRSWLLKLDADEYLSDALRDNLRWLTQDPDTDWTNLGTYRSHVLGKDILGSQIIKGKHGDMHMKKYQERGELMPAAAVVGCDPVLFLAGPRS